MPRVPQWMRDAAMCKGAYKSGKMQMEKAFKGLTKACGIQQSHGASR